MQSISSVSALFVKKINNLQVQIDINLKTVNCFKYKMDCSIVIVSMCIEKSTRIKGVKDKTFLAKNAQKPGSFFGEKWPKIWL